MGTLNRSIQISNLRQIIDQVNMKLRLGSKESPYHAEMSVPKKNKPKGGPIYSPTKGFYPPHLSRRGKRSNRSSR